MKLTQDEVKEVNLYLASALKKKRFDVRVSDKFGYIRNVSKFGVHCLPGTCHSYADGKQEYSYLCLSAGKTDPSDLGFYCSDLGCALKKYSQDKLVKIDMRTYKRIIDKFVEDLNNDYMKIGKPAVKEGLSKAVKIKKIGGIFDGKEGIVESEGNGVVTVLVNFDDKGHKIRHDFKYENLEGFDKDILVEEDEEELEIIDDEVILTPVEIKDERLLLLAAKLKVDPGSVFKLDNPEFADDYNYDNIYMVTGLNVDDTSADAYLVLEDKEAQEQAIDSTESTFRNMGASAFNINYEDFIDEDKISEMMRGDEYNRLFHVLSEEEVFEEAVSHGLLSEEDFEDLGDGHPNFSRPKKGVDLDRVIEDIVSHEASMYSTGVEWYKEAYGDDLGTLIDNYLDILDGERLIDYILDADGRGPALSDYDGEELYIGSTSDNKSFYAYRVDNYWE